MPLSREWSLLAIVRSFHIDNAIINNGVIIAHRHGKCKRFGKSFFQKISNPKIWLQNWHLPRGIRGVPLKRIWVWAPWNEHPDSVLAKNRRQTKPFRRSYTPERLFFFPKFQSVITPCSCLYSVPCGFHARIRRIFLLSFTLSKHWMIPPTRMPPTGFSVHSLVRWYLP